MKAWMIAAAGALAAGGLGLTAVALEGGYKSPSGATLFFDADGAMHVSLPDGNAFAEDYEVSGNTLTIMSPAEAPHDCPSTEGTYTFVESGDTLTFTLVSDSCEQRRTDMTAGVWTKEPE